MKKIIIISGILIIVSVIGCLFIYQSKYLINRENIKSYTTKQNTINKSTMTISSMAFQHNSFIPSKYTCDGENISPPLQFSNIPINSKSLVLIMDDPDAPSKTWVHWTIWNISTNTTSIEENNIPDNAVEGITSFETTGYGGPCPPSGTHRYFFKLYALDTNIDLSPNSNKEELLQTIDDHIISYSELIGLYKRQ